MAISPVMISPWQCHALEAPDGEEDFGGSLTDKSLLSHRQTQIPSQCPHVHTRDRTGGKVDLMIQIKLKFELSFFFSFANTHHGGSREEVALRLKKLWKPCFSVPVAGKRSAILRLLHVHATKTAR